MKNHAMLISFLGMVAPTGINHPLEDSGELGFLENKLGM